MATGTPTEGGNVYARLWNRPSPVSRPAWPSSSTPRTRSRSPRAWQRSPPPSSPHAPSTVAATVAVRPLYGGTDHLLASGLLGVETRRLHVGADRAGPCAPTCLVLLEDPGNPTLRLVDIARRRGGRGRSARRGRQHLPRHRCCRTRWPTGRRWPCATPPGTSAATAATRSAGVVVNLDLGRRAAAIRAGHRRHPAPARGVPAAPRTATLPLRVRGAGWPTPEGGGLAHEPSAVTAAGLPGADPAWSAARCEARRHARSRSGSRAASSRRRVAERLQLFTHAVSLGGVDSLVQHPPPHPSTRRTRGPSERGPAAALDRPGGRRDLQDDLARALT